MPAIKDDIRNGFPVIILLVWSDFRMHYVNIVAHDDAFTRVAYLDTNGYFASLSSADLKYEMYAHDSILVPLVLGDFNLIRFTRTAQRSASKYRTGFLNKYVVTREEWNAKPPKRIIGDPNKLAFVIHHTASQPLDTDQAVRNIQHHQMEKQNFDDLGYHFLISNSGRIFEGRSLTVEGQHTKGANRQNIGIALIGCFEPNDCKGHLYSYPNYRLIQMLARLIGALSVEAAMPDLGRHNVKARRELGAPTVSPGKLIFDKLDFIIDLARQFAESCGVDNESV